ncbi:hypothetical protein [Enterobacter roggenkampii]|uniref:hypothetical protein n=1 Tax=Enterobacter roggenkampii TaxID=1812935 RepID=UPI001BE02D19|nr:hypothetical protein [Enterobacter roggenkampii]WCF39290.1 hypothetical protein KK030_17680 [Enterobacter roggenkampii]
MNRTDAPKKQPVPFGTNGPRQDLLPTTPAGSNRASYDAGYPQVTMILKSAGGIPPEGQDMNQILFELSAIGRWLTAGALNAYDATFSSAVGGYPKASVLVGDDGSSIYISTVDANTNNPNSTSTGWLSLAKITAIAALSGGANKLPYFSGTNTAAQTDLTSVGRDIIGKSSIADILTYLGLSDSAGFVGRLIGPPKIFTSSGTYTPTPGTKKILIEVQGAGSGGGGAGSTSATSYSAGGNGTGGGYAMSMLDVAADKITSVPVTVGAGGLGGNGAPTGGNAGGASKFGSFITAGGGNGSLTAAPRDTSFTITGTYGGIATGGNIINRGGDGSDSVICIGGLIVIGRAGSSKFGAGGNGYANWNVSGKNGSGYGSGGTGATSNNSPGAYYSGGNGTDGIVIVWELA